MNRRSWLTLLMVLLCTLMLTGCGKKTLRGEVVEVNPDGFVLDQDIGGQVTVYTDEDTFLFSFIDSLTESDFREGNVDGMNVSVVCRKTSAGLMASQVQIMSHRIRDYYTLDDGTKVDLTVSMHDFIYDIPNVTELLRVRIPVGPENVQVVSQESLADLTEEAQQKILAYYDAQGLLYDEMQILEDAYDAFCTWDKFYAFYLSQEICPIASSDDVIYFLTDFLSDRGMEGTNELRLCTVFDKKTGEEIPITDIFTCKPEEILTKLMEICDLEKDDPIDEMKGAFRPEYVVFFPEYMEITFPENDLPEYGMSFGMSIDYTNEALQGLIQSWAVPNKEVDS